jgi:hypothetical protein
MPKFLVTYHGGGMPESEEGRQQAMVAFGAWVAVTGKRLVDPRAPPGLSKTGLRDSSGCPCGRLARRPWLAAASRPGDAP